MKNENEMFKMAQLRSEWVKHLKRHKLQVRFRTQLEMFQVFEWAKTTVITEDELADLIKKM